MNKRHIHLLLLVIGLTSCSVQQQVSQIKYGLKSTQSFYFNQSVCDNARNLLLKEIKKNLLDSDTIIIAESFISIHAWYQCSLYESNTGKIKQYNYVCYDYNKYPNTCFLKEEKVSEFVIINMQSMRTDINSYMEKIKRSRKTPSTTYMITFVTKVNGKYISQHFSASD